MHSTRGNELNKKGFEMIDEAGLEIVIAKINALDSGSAVVVTDADPLEEYVGKILKRCKRARIRDRTLLPSGMTALIVAVSDRAEMN